jgi:hypothetical protein
MIDIVLFGTISETAPRLHQVSPIVTDDTQLFEALIPLSFFLFYIPVKCSMEFSQDLTVAAQADYAAHIMHRSSDPNNSTVNG